MKWWYEPEEEMKVYKNEDLCIECKREFFSKPYDHRDPTPGTIGYCVHCDNCLIKDKERKMEFDKSRVFTALNADELRAGDKVIVADQLSVLKQRVQEGKKESAVVLQKINGEDWGRRFGFKMSDFALAYLVERKENCLKCKKCEVISDKSMHCDWVGTGPITSAQIEKCNHYEPKTGQKEMCLNCKHYNKVNDFRDCTLINNPTGACPHYEAEKHYRPFKNTDELIKVWLEKGGKWQKRDLSMPLIWVRSKDDDSDKGCLIISYAQTGVIIADADLVGASMERLYSDYTFLDGSVCGVEE